MNCSLSALRTALLGLALTAFTPAAAGSGDRIIFTANQGWFSRIYILDMDGTVLDYHEYEFYHFCDLEVVEGEVYAAEAFAPRVLKVDLETWTLDVIVDDWSLYYFYDVAFDGNHFHLTEWDLNRYELDGTKVGTSSFAYDTWGGAHDDSYYWTLNDDGLIRCWDVSAWPTLTEIPDHAFAPSSAMCRGLFFDGEYFWTTEGIDGALGFIYQFDHHGQVMDQWLAPAFQGWGACLLRGDAEPCPEDVAPPEGVEQQDLNAVLNRWGDPDCLPGGLAYPCPEDLAPPEGVEQQDLNAVLNRWGDPACLP